MRFTRGNRPAIPRFAASVGLTLLIIVGSRNLEHHDVALFGYTVASVVIFSAVIYHYWLWLDPKGDNMRALTFVIIRRNVGPLLGCLAIFTALVLASVILQPTITEGKNVQDAPGTTQASLVIDAAPLLLPQKPPLDFDGDGSTDYAVVRGVGGTWNWYLQRSTAGFLGLAWGSSSTDTFVPGDYDGDLKWDIAVWRSGTPAIYYILKSTTGALQAVAFGQTGDNPRITQDFDADGITDPAVARNVGGTFTWYIQRSTLGFTAVSFGNVTTDYPIRGDFDGDRKADVAIYRTSGGSPANTFYVLRSTDGGIQAQTFGALMDNIFPADFDGDGKTDYTVWRRLGGDSGTWYWLRSSDGGFRALAFGIGSTDQPVPGDYDGDGTSDQAVWRAGTPATFYVNRSTLGFVALSFGQTGDQAPGWTLQVR